MKNKSIIAIVLLVVVLIMQTLPIYASEGYQEEWYELVEEDFEFECMDNSEVTPYTMYLVNVVTSILKISSNKIGMRADIYCSATVKSINVVFSLQKLSGSTWKTVGTASASASNVSSTYKSVTASNVASGTYRVRATVKATDYNGYSETLTGYSGSINLP
ncbi:MAG: hypothetical protein ACI4DX_04215 [Oliverpabstia sp.]